MLHRKNEIIHMVNLALTGKVDTRVLYTLEEDDALYAVMIYSLGASVMSGGMSKETASRFIYKATSGYDLLCRRFNFWKAIGQRIKDNRKLYSVECSEVSRELNKKQPDAEKVLRSLIKCLDLLTGDDVYLKMLEKAFDNAEFEKECQAVVIKHGDELEARFEGRIKCEDYIHLLEDFYKACVDDGVAECRADFGEQPELKVEKAENPEAVADRLRYLYGG